MAISPLFKLYDPYGDLSSAAEFGALPGDDFDPIGLVPIRKRKPTLADLMPEEEKQSLLSQLAAQGTSGLSAIGYLLDTPGALVRGILAGKPLSGFGSSEERVSGRDLLRQYGLAGDKDNWGNFGGGLLAEIALDPLSYIGIGLLGRGATTSAGRLAKGAGLLADDVGLMARRANKGTAQFLRESTPRSLIDASDDVAYATQMWNQKAGARANELLDMPLARTNRLSFPGFGSGAADLYGKSAGDWLARASDRLGAAALATPALGPALRTTQALFDPRVLGFTDEQGQWLARELTDAERKAGRRADKYLSQLYVNAARDMGQDVFRSPEFAQSFRNAMEGQFDQIHPSVGHLFRRGAPGYELVAAAREYQEQAIRNAREAGVKLEYTDLPNEIEYMFRQKALVDNPTMPENFARPKNVAYDSGVDVFGVGGGQAQRRDYTRAFPTYVLDAMAQDRALQEALRDAVNRPSTGADDVRNILDAWLQNRAPGFSASLQRQGRQGPFDFLLDGVDMADAAAVTAAERRVRDMYVQLADSVRRTPLEYARDGIPAFGNSLNDFARYVRSRGRNEAAADVMLRHLRENPILDATGDFVPADLVPGGTAYSVDEALKALNLDHWDPKVLADGTVQFSPAMEALARKMGRRADELTNVSFQKEMIDQLRTKIQRARTPREAEGLLKFFDDMTQRFKTLALLWPARYSRDAYSGSFAGATQGAFNPLDWWAGVQARRGNYKPLVEGWFPRLKNAPGYQVADLFGDNAVLQDAVNSPLPAGTRAVSSQELAEAQIRKFLADAGGQGLTQASVSDDLGRMADNLTYKENFPGGAGGLFQNLARDPRKFSTWNPFALRTRQGNPNPLLELGDRVAEATDAGNRIGTYLTRIRKGDAPEAAKAIADLTQVVYAPSNFTAFERDFLKRLLPFYSYTKGIAPLVAGELVNNPAGLMGQSIRAVTRASEPKPEQFTPEYLRQSAAIPIDPTTPLFGLNTPGITRFLTNLDLPHEGLINLFTPGIGNTVAGRLGDTLMKTGSNILGQGNPYLKGPLEWVMNRQFYSGRQLSDLYSSLEQALGPTGRGLEQLAVNLPGGSRAIGTYRQLTDQRISPQERAAKFLFNMLTGLKLQDVDQERTVRLAARTSLNQLLDQAQGMSTYENLFIKPEDLAKLSPQEQRQYLLYRVLQSEAAKKARERKKQDALANPLAEFGLA